MTDFSFVAYLALYPVLRTLDTESCVPPISAAGSQGDLGRDTG